jgi:hypothetical protein
MSWPDAQGIRGLERGQSLDMHELDQRPLSIAEMPEGSFQSRRQTCRVNATL